MAQYIDQFDRWIEGRDLGGNRNLSSAKAMVVVSLFAILPGTAFAVQGYLKNLDCMGVKDECQETCLQTWAKIERTFMSQSAGERECLQKCVDEAATCSQRAALSVFAGILLAAGVCCTYCLLTITVSLAAESKVRDDGRRPRPSASEPISTEEERRKARAAAVEFWDNFAHRMGSCLGVLLCCCCFNDGFNSLRRFLIVFGNKVGFVPEPQNPISTKPPKARCRKCKIDFEVHDDWLRGEMSGVEGSQCPRCHDVVLGLI